MGTVSPETTSVMDRKTARMAAMNWAAVSTVKSGEWGLGSCQLRTDHCEPCAWSTQSPLHPVNLTSSPVKMGTVLSSCGAATVTLIVRTGQMRTIVVSTPGSIVPLCLLWRVCWHYCLARVPALCG